MTRGIWKAAVWLINEHGKSTPIIVEKMITDLRRGGAPAKDIASWILIEDAVGKLLTDRHDEETSIH